jgi:hypothetical protein
MESGIDRYLSVIGKGATLEICGEPVKQLGRSRRVASSSSISTQSCKHRILLPPPRPNRASFVSA